MTDMGRLYDEPDELDDLEEAEWVWDLPEEECVKDLYDYFKQEWEKTTFHFKGKRVKVNLNRSRVYGYLNYPDAFVHLITRESKMKQRREFDLPRACRLHWIKTILRHSEDPLVWYYEHTEGDGTLKQYYWYERRDYLVILKPIAPDLLLVTAFCVDKHEKIFHRKRHQQYRDGLKK